MYFRGVLSEAEPPTSLSPDLLWGRYRVERALGVGASSQVFAALDTATDTHVALKVVKAERAQDLIYEATALARVSHPCVARVIELLIADQPTRHPLVLRHGDGLLVQSLAAGEPPLRLALEPALRVARDVAAALAAIHAVGLSHGDIKPANVMFDGARATVIDLGLARRFGNYSTASGTPAYLAPEAFFGSRSVATDLYALGCLLHAILGGRSPLDDDVSVQVHDAARRALLSPRVVDPALPAGVRALLTDLLARDPALRPRSAADVQARLETLLADLFDIDDDPLPKSSSVARLPLIGHEQARARIHAALEEEAPLVIVTGPSGSGRSRVIEEAMRAYQLECVQRGAAGPTFVRQPRLPRVPMTRSAVLHVDAMPTPEELSAHREAAAVVDARLSVIVETRDHPNADVRLAPLSDESLDALLEQSLGQRPSRSLREVAKTRSGGLSGRLIRLLRAAGAKGRLVRSADDLRGTPDLAPERDLSEHALAALLACAGGRLKRSSVMGRDEELEGLRDLGLAVITDGDVVLRPDARRALLSALPTKRKHAYAKSLLRSSTSARERAYLHACLGQRDEAERALLVVVSTLREAARPRAVAELVSDLRDAFSLNTPRLRRAHADALRADARYDDALSVLRRGDDEHLRAEITRLTGALDEAIAILDEGDSGASSLVAHLALSRGDIERAEVHAGRDARGAEVLAFIEMGRGDNEAARAHVANALDTVSDHASRARLRSTLGTIAMLDGDFSAACAHYERAVASAARVGERHASATYQVNLGSACFERGALGPALASLRDGAQQLALIGRHLEVARALYDVSTVSLVSGALAQADRYAAAGMAAAYRARGGPGQKQALAYLHIAQAEAALRRGDLSRAREACQNAALASEDCAAGPHAIIAARRARVLVATGDRETAQLALTASDPTATPSDTESDASARTEHLLAAARFALATDPERAVEMASRASESATRFESRLTSSLLLMEAAERAKRIELGRRAGSQARALLDDAAATLDATARARLRSVPSYARVLSARPGDPDRHALPSRALANIAKRLRPTRSRARILEDLLDGARDLVGAERGAIIAREGSEVRLLFANGGLTEVSRSIVARAFAEARALLTTDARGDERLAGAASVHMLALRSVACVPMTDGEDRLLLYLEDRLRPAAFDERHRALLVDLGELASNALVGQRALAQARERESELLDTRRALAEVVDRQALELAAQRAVLPDIEAKSEAMRTALALARRAASSGAPVLLMGESGSGKDLIARAIHAASPRASQPWVSENCGAIPDALFDSALFGHVKGAFTGAVRDHVGLLRAADHGTLFLDEVAELSPSAQAKLLRVTQDGEVRPVGANANITIDARLITATRKDLRAEITRGAFREDLFYRLAVIVIEVPPLRDRKEDLPGIIASILHKLGRGDLRVDPSALDALRAHTWPGNVRELENELTRASLSASDALRVADLSFDAAERQTLRQQVDALERRLIQEALRETSGNRTRAAEALGVSRYGLQKMIKRLEISPDDER